MPSRRLAILRAQAALATAQDTTYKARCAAFESGDRPLPTPPAPTVATTDTWHGEPPPVPGVYIASTRRSDPTQRHWDGKVWSRPDSFGRRTGAGVAIEWLRLVKADAPPAPAATPTWRRGSDIPEAERTGLWHVRAEATDRHPTEASPADEFTFQCSEYRAAAPGTQDGDPYDEARYTTSGITS